MKRRQIATIVAPFLVTPDACSNTPATEGQFQDSLFTQTTLYFPPLSLMLRAKAFYDTGGCRIKMMFVGRTANAFSCFIDSRRFMVRRGRIAAERRFRFTFSAFQASPRMTPRKTRFSLKIYRADYIARCQVRRF